MRTLTEQAARDLDDALADAADVAREHAAQHSYRATACAAVGERILRDYHRRHHRDLLNLADRLQTLRAVVAQRTSPGPRRRRRGSLRPAS